MYTIKVYADNTLMQTLEANGPDEMNQIVWDKCQQGYSCSIIPNDDFYDDLLMEQQEQM